MRGRLRGAGLRLSQGKYYPKGSAEGEGKIRAVLGAPDGVPAAVAGVRAYLRPWQPHSKIIRDRAPLGGLVKERSCAQA